MFTRKVQRGGIKQHGFDRFDLKRNLLEYAAGLAFRNQFFPVDFCWRRREPSSPTAEDGRAAGLDVVAQDDSPLQPSLLTICSSTITDSGKSGILSHSFGPTFRLMIQRTYFFYLCDAKCICTTTLCCVWSTIIISSSASLCRHAFSGALIAISDKNKTCSSTACISQLKS